MKGLITWVTILNICLGYCQETVDINRINHGVMFKFIRADYMINRAWSHTFVFDIPSEILGNRHHDLLGNSTNSSSHSLYVDCIHNVDKAINAPFINPEDRRGTSFAGENDTLGLCVHLKEELEQVVKQVREKHEQLSELTGSLEALLPGDVPRSWATGAGSTRATRSLIPLVGRAVSGLFGLATESQLEIVANHADEVLKMARDQNKVFGKLTGDLTSFSKTVAKRIDGLVAAVQANTLSTHKIYTTYQGRLRVTETAIALFEKRDLLLWEMSKAEKHVEQFKNGLQLLNMGYLPGDMITPAMLADAILNIRTELRREQDRLTSTDPRWYYKRASFVHARVGNQLTIMVEFPLTRYRDKFRTYELVLVDMIIPKNHDAIMRLKTDVKGLSIGGDKRYQGHFVELTERDIIDIRANSVKRKHERLIKWEWQRSCLIAILRDDMKRINHLCQYNIIPGTRKPSVVWLEKSDFLLTGVDHYTLEVSSKNETTIKHGCEQCVITLPDRSTMEVNGIIALADFRFNTSLGDKRFTVNRPLASKFFSETELRMINGDTLLQLPPTFVLPKMNFKNPNGTDWIAEDRTLQLEMTKVIDSVKSDREVIHTLAHQVYSDIKLDSGDLISWRDWILIGVGGALLLMFIQIIYVMIKLRQLIVAITILNQISGVNSGIVFQYSRPTPMAPVLLNSDPGIRWENAWNCAGTWLAVGLIASMVLILTFWMAGRCCRKRTCQETVIALNIIGPKSGKIISLMSCHVPMGDVELRADGAPAALQVDGCLLPRLSFYWQNEVIIKSLRVSKTVPTSVRLSIAEAYVMNQVLKEDYQVVIVLIEGDRIKSAPGVPREVVKLQRALSVSSIQRPLGGRNLHGISSWKSAKSEESEHMEMQEMEPTYRIDNGSTTEEQHYGASNRSSGPEVGAVPRTPSAPVDSIHYVPPRD